MAMLDPIRRGLQALVGRRPQASYLRSFEIPGEALAATPKQAVAGRLLTWQSLLPQYPPANYRTILTRGYRNNPVLRRCIDILSKNFCQGYLEVVDVETGQPVEPHEMPGLFRHGGRVAPVPGLTEKTLWTRFIMDAFLYGNALWEKVRSVSGDRVVELWRLDPQYIAVEPDARTGIGRYLYQVGGQWWPIDRRNIVHWMFPDPLQEWFGIPPVYSALRELAVDNQLVDHFKLTLQNYAIPPLVLESDGDVAIDEEDAEEASDRWMEKVGRQRKGRPAILSPGTRVKVVGMDFSKLAIGELVATSENRIAMVHGVPMILLGRSGTEGDPTRANYGEAKEHFWFDTILPLQQEVADQVSTFLLPEWDPKGQLEANFNNSAVAILQEAKLRRAEKAAKLFEAGMVSRGRAQDLAGVERHGPDVFYRSSQIDGIVPADADFERIEIDTL